MNIAGNSDAQFMLLAGFIIAIGLVITTVMLNSIIFEGNMAIGAGTQISENEIINLLQVTKDDIRSAYRNATNIGGTTDQRIANFTNQTKNFSSNLPKIYALRGEGINISWDISNWNNSRYANFTENGTTTGATNWTVIESVKNATINIYITSITSQFNINITNATNTWQINFTSAGPSTINDSQIRANITQAYTISFMNGANAAGSYSINGSTTYGKNFTRARDYILSARVIFSTGRVKANITVPVSVPW